MADNVNQNIGVKATGDVGDYVAALSKMIEANKKLAESFKDASDASKVMDTALESAVNNKNNTSGIASKTIKNISKGSKGSLKSLSSSITNEINSMLAKVSGSVASSASGSKSIGGIVGNIVGNNMKLSSAGAAGAAGKAAAALGPVAIAVSGLTIGLVMLTNQSKKAYKTTQSMTKSYKELGSAADYAVIYAQKLNDQLGQSLDVTLEKLSQVVVEMRKLGMTTKQAMEASTQVDALSRNIAAAWNIDDIDSVREKFLSAMAGNGGLEFTGVDTSDSVMAAWIANTKGVNMYTTEISDAQMQAYRLEKIVQDLNNVTLTTGESLVNMQINLESTWAQNQKIVNQMDDIQKKWQAMTSGLYEVSVQIKAKLVDILWTVTNAILELVGKEKLKLDTGNIIEPSSLEKINDMNAGLHKTGDEIKAAKSQLLSFDELISLSAVKTLDNKASIDFGNTAELSNTGVSVADGIDKGIEGAKSLKDYISQQDIYAATTAEQLKEIWDGLDEASKNQYWEQFAMKFDAMGKELPDWLKNFDSGKKLAIWNQIKELMADKDVEGLRQLMDDLHSDGDYTFDLAIQGHMDAALAGYDTFQKYIESIEKKRTMEIAVKALLGILGLTLLGGALIGPMGAPLVIGAVLSLGIDGALETLSNLVSTFAGWISDAWNDSPWSSKKSEPVSNTDSADAYPTSNRTLIQRMLDSQAEKYGVATPFASGGVALRPTTALIAEGGYPEMVQPLGGPAAQQFYENVAKYLASSNNGYGNQPTSITVNIPVSNMFATNYELRQLSDIIADYLAEALRNRGALNSGVVV